jgi:hypothetical protein
MAEAWLPFWRKSGMHLARQAGARLLGYAEVHIEQGPALDRKNLLGVVSAIAGQTARA